MFVKYSIKENDTIYRLESLTLEFDCPLREVHPNTFILKNINTSKEYKTRCLTLPNAITKTTYINIFNTEPVPNGKYILQTDSSRKILSDKGKLQTFQTVSFFLESGIKETDIKEETPSVSVEIALPALPEPKKKTRSAVEKVKDENAVVYSALDSLRGVSIPTTFDIVDDMTGGNNPPNDNEDNPENPTIPESISYIERTTSNTIYFKFEKPIIDFRKSSLNLTAHGKKLSDSYNYELEIENGLLKLVIDKPKEDLLVCLIVGQGSLTYNDTGSNNKVIPLYGMYNIRMDYVSYFEAYTSQYFGIEIEKKITTMIVMILLRAEAIAQLHTLKTVDIIDLFLCIIQATNSPFKEGIMAVTFTSLKYLSSAAIGSLSASWDINTAQLKLLELSGPTMMHDYRHCFSLINGHTFLDDENLVHTGFQTIYGDNINSDTLERHSVDNNKNDDRWKAMKNKWQIY